MSTPAEEPERSCGSVLAHRRFSEDRGAFDGLSLAQRFDHIAATNLWGAETSRSGLGSEAGATAALRRGLAEALDTLSIGTLIDVPCGEFGWIRSIVGDRPYLGLDIVPSIIAANQAVTADDQSLRFAVADITRDRLPPADLIVCRDCLVHLSLANAFAAIDMLKASGSQFLAITQFPRTLTNTDIDDGDWRPLNFMRPPFSWPPPEREIIEECDEGEGLWSDKALAIWRLSDLPSPWIELTAPSS